MEYGLPYVPPCLMRLINRADGLAYLTFLTLEPDASQIAPIPTLYSHYTSTFKTIFTSTKLPYLLSKTLPCDETESNHTNHSNPVAAPFPHTANKPNLQ